MQEPIIVTSTVFIPNTISNCFQFHVCQAQDEGVLVTIDAAFKEGTVRCATIGHHQRFDAFLSATYKHHSIGIGQFLRHVEEEVIGETVDVLHLLALLEHEHPHSLLTGNEFARPAKGHTIERDVGRSCLLWAHLFLCTVGQEDML